MIINIVHILGSKYTKLADFNTRVRDIISAVSDDNPKLINSRLVYNQQFLPNDSYLCEFGIRHGDTLMLIERFRGA